MLCSFEAMAVQIAKVKIEIFKQKMTKIQKGIPGKWLWGLFGSESFIVFRFLHMIPVFPREFDG